MGYSDGDCPFCYLAKYVNCLPGNIVNVCDGCWKKTGLEMSKDGCQNVASYMRKQHSDNIDCDFCRAKNCSGYSKITICEEYVEELYTGENELKMVFYHCRNCENDTYYFFEMSDLRANPCQYCL